MPSKTITIKEEVFKKLLKLKGEKESFSDLLDRLAEKEFSLQAFIKVRGTLDFGGDSKSLIEEIYEHRKEWRESKK